MTTWIPDKKAGCIGVSDQDEWPMPKQSVGTFVRLWVIPNDVGMFPIKVRWRSEEGAALVRAVIEGTTPPGILADWCDEHQPSTGKFTSYMGNVLRGLVAPDSKEW